MLNRVLVNATVPMIAMIGATFIAFPAAAKDRDAVFFQKVEGQWNGPGEIVAGKYKGTKFNCTFTGSTPSGQVGMSLDGSCRVGVFAQKMSASVKRRGRGYRGTFLDGATGKGLDITSGNIQGSRVVFSLNRKKLKGAMLARLPNDNTMNVTVSVRVNKKLVPVVGMKLRRQGKQFGKSGKSGKTVEPVQSTAARAAMSR